MATSKVTPRSLAVNFKRPKLFSTAFTRRAISGEGQVRTAKGQIIADSNITNTASFRYDPPGLGLRSTQQIPLDWSLFENHTFFNSAEANVNVSFNKIINEYPFDGTREEVEFFLDGLTGFEKWVFDSFPKGLGQFYFITASNPCYIPVNDFAGSENPSFSSKTTGEKVIDPGVKSYTIEFHSLFPEGANDDNVIIQYLNSESSGDYGFSIIAESTGSTSEYSAKFLVTSGALAMSTSIVLPKGATGSPSAGWSHLAFTHNRTPGVNKLEIYKDSVLVATSANSIEMGKFGFTNEKFLIASGASHTHTEGTFTPAVTPKFLMDELRVFHGKRSIEQLKKNAQKNVYASDDLKLYFKFNEPSGSLGTLDNIVLDSSGNSLHSRVTGYTDTCRTTGSLSFGNPLVNERRDLNPILFPSYREVIILNGTLLSSASLYDNKNPNLITRLIPQHYLQEGYLSEGLQSEEGTIGDQYLGDNLPGTGQLGSAQLLTAFLFVWAKYFDEMKIFIDHLSKVLHVDYDIDGTVSDQFLPMVFRYHGLDVPSFFSDATIEQFIDGENIGVDFDVVENSLQNVQNQMWRRILVNLGDIVRSKGTLHSIKSLIRSVGINPDSTLRIREYGGPTERNLIDARFDKTEIAAMLNFSGALAPVSSTLDSNGIPDNKPYLITTFLSMSRTEVGTPAPSDSTFSHKDLYPPHGISSNASDGYLTSGSWSFEGLYKFESLTTGSHPVTQSLMRLNTTGSLTGFEKILIGNVVAYSGSTDLSSSDSLAKIEFHMRPTSGSAVPHYILPLTGVNIFDGNVWSVSAGKEHHVVSGSSVPSSSYFLRAARQHYGEIVDTFVTSSLYEQDANDLQSTQDATLNASGCFIAIGSQSINQSAVSSTFLHSDVGVEGALSTEFSGKVGQIRFWSKALGETEWLEHVRNFKSLGVSEPFKNFNFNTTTTGAWERLRVDLSCDQPVTDSNAQGEIDIFDFSQNSLTASVIGLEASTQIITPETFRFSYISPKFDEAGTNNKVRVRSFLSQEKVDKYNASVAPVYEITPSEVPADDTRFTIDFSVVGALDEDIVKIFSSLDYFDNAIGNPELRYSEDYPDLERLRSIYFNRLTEKMNLKGFFEFFKWFDGSIGMFIEQLLPRKTNYLGSNFVIESHMLERPKVRYVEEDSLLDENLRNPSTTVIVQEAEGSYSD